jgi:hypothetical protein
VTVPAFTVYANHPRVLFRDTDKTALTARTNSVLGWKTIWDGTITSRANVLKAASNSTLTSSKPDKKLFLLAFYGWIEETGRPALGWKDVAIRAAIYLAGLSDTVAPTDKRERIAALAWVMDILFDDLTTGERNTLAAELEQQRTRMSKSPAEEMDGWSRTDQVHRVMAALAVHGWGSYAAQAEADLQDALAFLYGSTAGTGCIEMLRWSASDGGSDKGGWYVYQANQGDVLWMQTMTKGTTHNAWAAEATYLEKTWQWYIWTGWRGGVDGDIEAQQDMARGAAPFMHHLQRWTLGALATNYPTPSSTEGGKHLRWLWDQLNAKEAVSGDDAVWDVLLLDREAVPAVHPKDGAPVPATSRLFDPPGIYYYRGSPSGSVAWDFDASSVLRVSGRKRYRLGHPHLDSGAVQIRYRDDSLLLSPAGYYDAFSSTHHVDAYQRGWLQSLVPLIVDPVQSYQRYGSTVTADGGPHFKKVMRSGVAASDPDTLANMLGEAGGEAWLSCRRFQKVQDDANVVFLILDSEMAYRKFHTDPPRATVLETKFLVIKPTAANTLVDWALLWYARIRKRDAAWTVKIPLHSAGPITTTATGATWTGYRTIAGTGSPGKMTLHIRNIAAYTVQHATAGTPLDANGFGPDQWKIGGTGLARPPSEAIPLRHRPDVKIDSLYVERTSKVEEEHYVFLLMPGAAAATAPTPTWITDAAQPNFYAVQLGTKTYGIGRTEEVVYIDAPDTTPPANVTGQTLAARDRALAYAWTDPVDSDFKEVEVFIRTSAV